MYPEQIMLLDLHTHSTASDGTLSPEELILEAAHKNLKYLALTDHDTIDGLSQISTVPDGLIFINGVEISAEFPKTLHILVMALTRNILNLITHSKNYRIFGSIEIKK